MKSKLENLIITPESVRTSSAWFNEQVKILSAANMTPNKILSGGVFKLQTDIVPGKLYFYFYDAKLKDTLPYWDQFPLVFPFNKTADAFTGLNLHYLDYKSRMMLLKELLKVNGNNTYTETKKIKFSWGLVKSMAKLSPAKACVKMYLFDHMASPFCEVSPTYWHTAMLLPVQRFVGASNNRVWSDSKRKG